MILLLVFFLALLASALWPSLDLTASGFFYHPGQGFYLANQPVLVFLHDIATTGARLFAAVLAVFVSVTALRRRPFLSIDKKGWLFLLLGLLLAPGLFANVILKDHWGRARPRDVTEFGGSYVFSPALSPQPVARRNGSFVSGDGAFGFYLSAFAYVAAPRIKRRVFWSGMGAGVLFGFARLAMGAHFLSDNLFAAFLMLTTMAVLHAAMYGWQSTRQHWRGLFIRPAIHV